MRKVISNHRRFKFINSALPPLNNLQNWYTFREQDITIDMGISEVRDNLENKDLEQTTNNRKPEWVTDGINGREVASFDGSNDLLRTISTFTALTQPYTIAAVLQRNGGSATVTFLNDHSNSVRLLSEDGNRWTTFDAGTTLTSSAVVGAGVPHTFVTKFLTGSGTNEIRIDGVLDATGGGNGTLSLSGITLGASGGDTNHAECYIGEVLIYDADLTGSDLNQVEGYLGGKWGTH